MTGDTYPGMTPGQGMRDLHNVILARMAAFRLRLYENPKRTGDGQTDEQDGRSPTTRKVKARTARSHRQGQELA